MARFLRLSDHYIFSYEHFQSYITCNSIGEKRLGTIKNFNRLRVKN